LGALLNRPKSQGQTGLSNLQRLEDLESLLTAVEQWFKIYHTVPLDDWIGIAYSIWTQYMHCIILLFRLSTLDEPGWDKSEVKKRANLLEILERLIHRLDNTPEYFGMVNTDEADTNGLFFHCSRLIQGMKATFAAELATTTLQTDVKSGNGSPATEAIDSSLVSDGFTSYVMDDPWMADLMHFHEGFDF
jgi:hypothetical protein